MTASSDPRAPFDPVRSVALGDAADAVAVATLDDAINAIEHLKTRQGGRAAMLLGGIVESSSLVPRDLPQGHRAAVEVVEAADGAEAVSKFKADYSVEYLPTNPWIHQPFEPYDSMRPAALMEKWKV